MNDVKKYHFSFIAVLYKNSILSQLFEYAKGLHGIFPKLYDIKKNKNTCSSTDYRKNILHGLINVLYMKNTYHQEYMRRKYALSQYIKKRNSHYHNVPYCVVVELSTQYRHFFKATIRIGKEYTERNRQENIIIIINGVQKKKIPP